MKRWFKVGEEQVSMDEDKLLAIIEFNCYRNFMDNVLAGAKRYDANQYPLFLAHKILEAFERGELQ